MSEELKPKRYEFYETTWCGGKLSANCEEDSDGEYVRLEDVQEAIAAWNRRATPPAAPTAPSDDAVRDAEISRLIAEIRAAHTMARRDSLFEKLIEVWEAHTAPKLTAPESALAEAVLAWWDEQSGQAPAFVELAMQMQAVKFDGGRDGQV